MNAAQSFLHHWWIDSPRRWHPLLGVYYLTYACDFRCPYCSDGAGRPYHRLRSSALPGPQALALLQRMRRHCSHLVITGGEPLQHPDFGAVLAGLPGLRFRGVILTTNGHAVGPWLPELARSIDHLVFSLQTLDPARGDAWYGLAGAHGQILENLDRAAGLPGRRYRIIK